MSQVGKFSESSAHCVDNSTKTWLLTCLMSSHGCGIFPKKICAFQVICSSDIDCCIDHKFVGCYGTFGD